MEGGEDLYQLLGIPINCPPEEVRLAYFEGAKRLHPDANPDPGANEDFLRITQAYEILNHPAKRLAYDTSLSRDSFSKNVAVKILYSRSTIQIIEETQLVYGLLEIANISTIEKTLLPSTHICLVIDRSTSMEGDRMDMVKLSVIKLFRSLKSHDYISVVSFSDRAEVVVPPTLVSTLDRFEFEISLLRTGGGTEIFQGLNLGMDQLRKNARGNSIRRLILITDGHTYGDEQACIELGQDASVNGIIISALGIGPEWNDNFLDRLTIASGGSANFASTPDDLPKMLDQISTPSQYIYANNINFNFKCKSPVQLRFTFRIFPDLAHLENESPLVLGHLPFQKKLIVLFEFLIDRVPDGMERLHLAEGFLEMDMPGGKQSRFYLDFHVGTANKLVSDTPPSLITDALSRITLFRLQRKAREEVDIGKYEQASTHLQHLATRLLAQGERELAHTVLLEVENLRQLKSFSKSGDKRIKYGTRALCLSPSTDAFPTHGE